MGQLKRRPYIFLYICLLTRFNFFVLSALTNDYSIDYTYLLKSVVIAENKLKGYESTPVLAKPKTDRPQRIQLDIVEEEIHLTNLDIQRKESTNKVKYRYNPYDGSHLFSLRAPYLIDKVFNGPKVIWNSADHDVGFCSHVLVYRDGRGKMMFRVYFHARPKSQILSSSDEDHVSEGPRQRRGRDITYTDSGDDFHISDEPKHHRGRAIPYEESGDEYYPSDHESIYFSEKPRSSRQRNIPYEESDRESDYKSDKSKSSKGREIAYEDSGDDFVYKSDQESVYISDKSKSSKGREIAYEDSGDDYIYKSDQEALDISVESKPSRGREIEYEDSGEDYIYKSDGETLDKFDQPKPSKGREIAYEDSGDDFVYKSDRESVYTSEYESDHKSGYKSGYESEQFDQHEFTLDVSNTDSTIFVHYIRQEPFTDIFIPKAGYAITKILKDEKIAWLYKGGDYPAKVLVEPDEAGQFKVVVLFPKDLKGKRILKSPKINHLHGIEIYTKGSARVNDAHTYELSAVKNISIFTFKQGVKCYEVRYLGQLVWKHGDFGYSQYPKGISYFRDRIIDVSLGGPFLTYERRPNGVWRGRQCELRLFVRDPEDETKTKEIEGGQYELKERHGDMEMHFFKGVKCVEIWYKDCLVWDYQCGRYPIGIDYVPNQMIYVHFPNEFVVFIRGRDGNWAKHVSDDIYKYSGRSYTRGGKHCLFEWIKDVTAY